MKIIIHLLIFTIIKSGFTATVKDLTQYCNPISTIKLEDELLTPTDNFELKKVFIIVRHGDRGPNLQIKDLDQVDCDLSPSGNDNDNELFQHFLTDTKRDNYTVRADPKCHPGLLTNIGFLQHLKLGNLLGNNYISKLELNKTSVDSLKIYSTEILRTRESATAFLYPILKSLGIEYTKEYSKIITTDSQSFFCIEPQFCDRNCTVKPSISTNSTEKLDLNDVIQVAKYVNDLAPFLATNKTDFKLFNSPIDVSDGLMTYYCHNFTIPCIEDENSERCFNTENMTELTTFLGKVLLKYSTWNSTKNSNFKFVNGFLNYMFSEIESINGTEKLILLSGHDSFISSLSSALNFYYVEFPSFASRIIFESYRNRNNNRNYLRIIHDGKDVTALTQFCKLKADNCLKSNTNKLIDTNILKLYTKQKFESIFNCQ